MLPLLMLLFAHVISYDIIESLVPKQHKKLIVHIRKMVTKQQKKKEQNKVTEKARTWHIVIYHCYYNNRTQRS